MEILIKTKNIELTDSLESLIQKRMGMISKFTHDDAKLMVEIERDNKHHKKGVIFMAEGILRMLGKKVTAQARGEDLIKCITEVKKELELELKKYKSKLVEVPRRQAKKSSKQNRS